MAEVSLELKEIKKSFTEGEAVLDNISLEISKGEFITLLGSSGCGSRVFTELLKNADLDSPFEESCLRGVCEEAKAWLDSYDLTGIA